MISRIRTTRENGKEKGSGKPPAETESFPLWNV